MSEFLVLLTVVVPLVLVALWPARRCRAWVGRLTVFAPLPAILLVVVGDDVMVELPWLLLGSRWGLDSTGRVFLGFTAVLWLASGSFARSYLAHDPRRDRFELFWLLTMSGNLGVTVAQDMASFLLFFTLMSLAAYGLITHDRKPESLRAGRTYMVLVILGEVLLFWAVVIVALETGDLYFDDLAARLAVSPLRSIVAGLLIVGFGIKLGMMPLHVWLPLAHPAAPTPASAVLSGAIIKTGLLGLLRFLPLGEVAMPEWGTVCLVTGIASALVAACIGLTQDNPKTVLAYSSVSQMGLVSIGLGAALLVPAAWPMINAAIMLFAVHHAVTKAALFLGVGVAQANISHGKQTLVAAGLVLAALALAGLPLTSGFAGKNALKYTAAATPESWATTLEWILPLTGITTTLLVIRFLYVVWPSRQHPQSVLTPRMAIAWGVLTAGVVGVPLALRSGGFVEPAWISLAVVKMWAAIWPMVGAGMIVFVLRATPLLSERLQRIRIPAGDVVVPVTMALSWGLRIWSTIAVSGVSAFMAKTRQHLMRSVPPIARQVLNWIQRELENDLTAGLLIGLLAVVMFALMIL